MLDRRAGDFEAGAMVFAEPGLVEAERFQMLDESSVSVDLFAEILVVGVKGRREDTETLAAHGEAFGMAPESGEEHSACSSGRGGGKSRWNPLTCAPSPGDPLARDDLIQAVGTVEKILGGGRYRIMLESGQVVTAQLSGRMRRFRIRVIPGDRVQVGVSPYDPTHGFITFRLREGQMQVG